MESHATTTTHARIRVASLSLLVLLATAGTSVPAARAATAARTTRVSVNSREVQAGLGAYYPTISGSGRFVAFESTAANLVKGDTNAEIDVFVRDRNTGTTERVSVRSSGAQGNSWSGYSSISGNGRFVAFTSPASNLVSGDGNANDDVFVHDRRTGVTTRISVSSGGREGNADSDYPSISADGRFVAFYSVATNLVKGDANGFNDLFVHDRKTGTTKLVTVSSSGAQANAGSGYLAPGSISGDGRYVVFGSDASNLVGNDTNGQRDIFIRDLVARSTKRVSVGSSGQADNASTDPTISADGRSVTFVSFATNLIANDTNGVDDVFVRDLGARRTRRVSVGSAGQEADNYSTDPTISGDGRYVAFRSSATNLIAQDVNANDDVFVRDLSTGTTRRVSVGNAGQEGNATSGLPFISGSGQWVVFQSDATNLVKGDTNAAGDIFVRGPLR